MLGCFSQKHWSHTNRLIRENCQNVEACSVESHKCPALKLDDFQFSKLRKVGVFSYINQFQAIMKCTTQCLTTEARKISSDESVTQDILKAASRDKSEKSYEEIFLALVGSIECIAQKKFGFIAFCYFNQNDHNELLLNA